MSLSCPRCLNNDRQYFFYLNGKMICRKCIGYIGEEADNNYKVNCGYYKLDYNLTKYQRMASDFVLKNIINRKNCAVNAVCGAGKTEIIYDTLKYCLNSNLKVGVAIPRKDVVIELQERISKDFNVNVVGVYGGNHKRINGDIIIFTTHQCYRYINYFDVLIIDEIDAFPYNNNETLQGMISKCSKNFVYMSATMPKYIEKNKCIEKFYLNRRYHGYDLPIPKCYNPVSMKYCLKYFLRKYKDKLVLVYFPTITLENQVARKVKCDYLINSKTINRSEMLLKIKNLDRGVVFTTTILERGITIKDVQVIIYNADHKLFSKDTLIQISGRVGRHKLFPKGDIIFICKIKNKSIMAAITTLKKCNE